MLQVRRRLDLGEEALGAQRGRELGVQHLDRHLAVVPDVVGEIDGGHPTRAEFALDAVAVGECGDEAIWCGAHCFIRARKSANQLSTWTRRIDRPATGPTGPRKTKCPSFVTSKL